MFFVCTVVGRCCTRSSFFFRVSRKDKKIIVYAVFIVVVCDLIFCDILLWLIGLLWAKTLTDSSGGVEYVLARDILVSYLSF